MPRNLIYGVNTSSNYFIGLNPLDDLLTKLKNEVSNISSVKTNFDNIINLNLPQVCQEGFDQCSTYQSTYINNTIASGAGSQVVPNSGGSNLEKDMNIVKKEFENYKEVAVKINQASIEGSKISNSNEQTNFINQITSLQTEVTKTKKDFQDYADKNYNIFETIQKSQKGVSIGTIVVVCFLIVTMTFILIILFL